VRIKLIGRGIDELPEIDPVVGLVHLGGEQPSGKVL
jgi:hypothetical protein